MKGEIEEFLLGTIERVFKNRESGGDPLRDAFDAGRCYEINRILFHLHHTGYEKSRELKHAAQHVYWLGGDTPIANGHGPVNPPGVE